MILDRAYRTEEVFGVSAEPPLSYQPRHAVDGKLARNLANDKAILVYGPSGQGKTALVQSGLAKRPYAFVSCFGLGTAKEIIHEIYKDYHFYCTDDLARADVEWEVDITLGVARAQRKSSPKKPINLPPLENADDLARRITDLKNSGEGRCIVLDDVHRLPSNVLTMIAELTRNLFNKKFKVILIAAWRSNLLPGLSGQLSNRLEPIDAGE